MKDPSKIPKNFKKKLTPGEQAEIREICQSGYVDVSAERWIEAGVKPIVVREYARAREIKAVCSAAKSSESANGFIAAGWSAEDVRNLLMEFQAARESATAINGARSAPAAPQPAAMDPAAIYAARQAAARGSGNG